MSEWGIAFEPECGWRAFDKHQELSDAIWEGLTHEPWLYMNFTFESSIWESRTDGSTIVLWYEHGTERVEELKISGGLASTYMEPIVKKFVLVPRPSHV